MNQQEAFEAWALRQELSIRRNRPTDGMTYFDTHTDCAWCAWQAGAKEMREIAAKECESWDCGNKGHRRPKFSCHADDALAIRALPVGESSRTPEGSTK